MKSIQEMFPRASQSTISVNPHLSSNKVGKIDSMGIAGAANGKLRGSMNATEREYSLILESMRQRGEILKWHYEGITLRWAGIRYTPDFVVFAENLPEPYMKLIEVKGPWIKGKFERAIERFRHARTYWPEFAFELWQKTKEGWIRKQ